MERLYKIKLFFIYAQQKTLHIILKLNRKSYETPNKNIQKIG